MSRRTPAPRPHARLVACALGVAALATLTACGGSSTSTTATAGPGTSSAAASSPSATSTPTSAFALLPESVLAPMSPLVYSSPAGADAGMVAQGAKPAVNAVFGGGISREMTYQGKTVGGVELYRFDTGVPADARAKFVPLMVQSFAQVAPKPTTLAGTKVEVADGARGTDVSVVGWTQGDDVVLVWAQGLPATQQIAAQYIAQSSKG